MTLAIKPGKGWRPHTPGQYLRLGVEVNGVRHWRAYSLTSRTSDGCVAVTVKAVPGGAVSNHLVRRCTVGTIVHLDQPAGEFTLGTPAPDKILFVTAGSGITPIMGMLRNLSPDEAPDITVVHSAPNAENVIFGGELRMLASRKRIRLVEIHTDTEGRLDIDLPRVLSTTSASARPGPVGPPTCLMQSNSIGLQSVWLINCTQNDSEPFPSQQAGTAPSPSRPPVSPLIPRELKACSMPASPPAS